MLEILFLIIILLNVNVDSKINARKDKMSPLYQNLPSCSKTYTRILKKTNSTALLCPMFKDEEGFLAEWVAYYQMQGIGHIMMYDDHSTDNSLKELEPWIKSGFVTVKSNWTMEGNGFKVHPKTPKFQLAMVTKALMERDCKIWGIEHGYNYFFSLDIDEYVIPTTPLYSLVDQFDEYVLKTGRVIHMMDKFNFQSTPHLLEPVDLLTIEAYQTRMPAPLKMNYYTTVSRKLASMLVPPESVIARSTIPRSKLLLDWGFDPNKVNKGVQWLADCCTFHGCSNKTPGYLKEKHGMNHCSKLVKEDWKIKGAGKKWMDAFLINHYSRSLEKFELKSRTWSTSSGEISSGETAESVAKKYDLPSFFARSVGWMLDRSAVKYSCQLREQLRYMDPELYDQWLRPGGFWYRNLEFGKYVNDPRKRGRYGRASGLKKFDDGNIYHYKNQVILNNPKERSTDR